jgi:hypothetical protein
VRRGLPGAAGNAGIAGKLTARGMMCRFLYIHLDDVEPQSKKMSEADKG